MLFIHHYLFSYFFFFNDTATTEIYTLSLHDALPIFPDLPYRQTDREYRSSTWLADHIHGTAVGLNDRFDQAQDRKSTRLNSSHSQISYAVFCLKKKKKNNKPPSLS